MITMESPAKMLEQKKKIGSSGEYHSGCSLAAASRNIPPRADWCSVESITPKIGDAQGDTHSPRAEALPAQPLEDSRRELDELAGEVQSDVPRHQEHHRSNAERHDHRVGQPPRAAKVEE